MTTPWTQDQGIQWVSVSDPTLPSDWAMYVCVKDGRRTKLTKFVDPSGRQFKNLQAVHSYLATQHQELDEIEENNYNGVQMNPTGTKRRPIDDIPFALKSPPKRPTHSVTLHEGVRATNNPVMNLVCCGVAFGSYEKKEAHIYKYHRKADVMQKQQLQVGNQKIQLFMCDKCDKKYKTQDQLNKHKSKEHGPEFDQIPGPRMYMNGEYNLEADLVGNIQSLNVSFEQQVSNQEDQRVSRCKICRFQTLSTNTYKSHMNDHYLQMELERVTNMSQLVTSSDELTVTKFVSRDSPEVLEITRNEVEEENYDGNMYREQYTDSFKYGYNNRYLLENQMNSLNILQPMNRTENKTSIYNDLDDTEEYDEDDDQEEEEEEEEDDEECSQPEEITLDDEPEEITLDEDAVDEEITVVSDTERLELKKMSDWENMVTDSEIIRNIIEDSEELTTFQTNSWYRKPLGWKPTKPGETWLAKASQICRHYKLRDISLAHLSQDDVKTYHNQDMFLAWMVPKLQSANSGKNLSAVRKLAKSKWFKLVEPVIPVETATVDDDGDY